MGVARIHWCLCYTGYTRLMSKPSCFAKLLHASLTCRECRHSSVLIASLPESALLSRELKGTQYRGLLGTLTWTTYDACLSRQLDQANSLIPGNGFQFGVFMWLVSMETSGSLYLYLFHMLFLGLLFSSVCFALLQTNSFGFILSFILLLSLKRMFIF